MENIVDVLIIGAGVSGIGMASRLSKEQPNKTFALLERKQEIGGTWSTFRYPGVRSDSDMFTYGFKFNPWRKFQTLADGTSIRNYLKDTASDFDVSEHITYGQRCTSADWDSKSQTWTVHATEEPSGNSRTWRARFIVSAQGYYNHDKGYTPNFPGADNFKGQTIHPQEWPEDLNYSGKNVVVIGSGATAVTLAPALAKTAKSVTMLQRSPTYVVSLPGIDHMTKFMSKFLPQSWTYAIARKRNLELWQTTYKICQKFPKLMRRLFVGQAKKHLGDAYSDKNFNPTYGPWDQRLCAVPDADLFKAVRERRAEVLTDHIDEFTADGIQLKSGRHLDADIIVTATGLSLQMFGGMAINIDGAPYDVTRKMVYKSVLLEDLPNFGWIIGYINLSWTMKADMSSLYICRMIKHMDQKNLGQVIPRDLDGAMVDESMLGQLTAGYVQRGADTMPRQGLGQPWEIRNNYAQDKKMMLHTRLDDRYLETKPAVSNVVDGFVQPARSLRDAA